MTKTATVPIGIGNPDKPDDPPVFLEPGDEVPSWAEKHIKPQYMSEDHPVAAGSDLYDDPIYVAAVGALRELGVEPDPSLDASQIAALVRTKVAANEVEATMTDEELEDEDYVSGDEQVDTMKALFGETNAAGNVNAPDSDSPEVPTPKSAPTSTRSTSTKSGSTGGADS